MDRDEYLSRVEALQKRYRKNARAENLFLAALGHAGVNLRRTFWDWLYLRLSPHGEEHSGRRTAKLSFHRDTWSSNVYAQTNWWAPIYPISPGRTIAFYGEYWGKPVKNTSADWNLEEIRSGKSTAPLVSKPSEPVDTGSEFRPVIEPGDLLCFSGRTSTPACQTRQMSPASASRCGQLTPGTRRTAAVRQRGRRGPRVATGWFRHVDGGSALSANRPEV